MAMEEPATGAGRRRTRLRVMVVAIPVGLMLAAAFMSSGTNREWWEIVLPALILILLIVYLWQWFALAARGAQRLANLPAERREQVRLKRIARGECGNCGYDLRGGHERCPECGSPYIVA